jgi:hypothetical protein
MPGTTMRFVAAAAVTMGIALQSGGLLEAQSCPLGLTTASPRGSGSAVVGGPHYDYAPSVMLDGVYRMWWCSTTGVGDSIMYATASSLDGPWTTPQAVFSPTYGATFDGEQTCDPSVIRVNGVYYLYYSGKDIGPAGPTGTTTTRIGLATSVNGINWVRANGGNPIITPRLQPGNAGWSYLSNHYGAGQQSVIHLNGYFYLIYTDTSGLASAADCNGCGQYVVRSADPTFQTGVQELVGPGNFQTKTTANHTTYSLGPWFAGDWQYVDTIDAFAITHAQAAAPVPPTDLRVTFFDATLATTYGQVTMPINWVGTGGLVSRPDKHAVASATCGTIPIDVMTEVGTWGQPFTTDLAHKGLNVLTGRSCACSNTPRVLDGYIVLSPGLPWMIPVGGKALYFALAGSAQQLSKNYITVASDAYSSVPYGAALYSNNAAYYTNAQPWAFLLDDGRLWPGSCYNLFASNGSYASFMAESTYAATPKGPALYCVQ